MDRSFARMEVSPLRKAMAVSQPGKCTVMVCGPSGGHECPNSVVMGLKSAMKSAMLSLKLCLMMWCAMELN